MMKKTLLYLIYIATAAAAMTAVVGCTDNNTGPPGSSDTLTVIFRDGAEPLPSYTGTRDAVIRDGPSLAMRTRNDGTAPLDTLGIVSIGAGLYERRMLLRFDLTSITDCGSVTGAMLKISVEPEDTNRTVWLDAWEATVPATYPGSWVEGFLHEGVSWLYVDEGVSPWTEPGGDHLGLMDSRPVKTDTTVIFELDAARVETWIKVPSSNDGLLLIPRTGGQEAFLHVFMRESAAVGLRPELTVRYLKGG